MHHRFVSVLRLGLLAVMIGGLLFPSQSPAYAASTLSIEPNSWNIIGLDSNTPATGPFRFPIGAKVCNSDTVLKTNVVVTFHFDNGTISTDAFAGDAYINLRPGSLQTITIPSIAAGDCEDAFFEVEVLKNASAFDQTREYHIVTDEGGPDEVSTPQPRELYVEHLISQNRNSVTDVELDDISIAAGGTMTLMVGNTYKIDLEGGTATQGYNQFEDFINFPNTIFQILSVETDYSANSKPLTPDPNYPYLYADACGWDNDPDSPTYRSCIVSDDKAGGSTVTTTYIIKIIGGAGTTQTLNTLLYDFSGSSYHYNSDFSVGTRYAYIVGPSSITMTKSFSPKAIAPAGTSVMTIKLVNPTTQTISGANFVDTFPNGLVVSGAPGVTYSECGAGTFSPAPVGTATSVSFTNGTISPKSICTITLNVTAASSGTYVNTTNHLFIDVNGTNTNTGNNTTDTLTVASVAACTPGQILAAFDMPAAAPGNASPVPDWSFKAANVSFATASYTAGASGGVSSINAAVGSPAVNSWEGSGFIKDAVNTATSAPYFGIAVDTSKYSNVSISLRSYATANWATSNTLKVWSSTDGTNFFATTPGTGTLAKTTWSGDQTFAAAGTGSATTSFRINADGANPTGASMLLDHIVITGCATPTPAPTITKSFSPDPIVKGSTSTLTFTISNTATGNQALANVSFTDVLPSGLDVTTSSTLRCGGTLTTTAGTRTIALAGASLVAGGSCTFSVTVTGTTEGDYENVTGYLSSTQTGTTTSYATDTLKVIAPPILSKAFSPTSIFTTENSTLSFTIKNPNLSTALSGIGFTDTLPAGVTATNGTTNSLCTSGSLVITGGNLLTFTAGSLAANSSCTFDVPVTGTTPGTKNNTTSAVTSTEGGNGNTASASLIVQDRSPSLSLTKQISAVGNIGPWLNFVSVDTNSSVWYRFVVYNSGDVGLTGITVSDSNVDVSSCISTSLSPGETYYCVVGPIPTNATAGEYQNTAQAHGTYVGVVNSPDSTATYANPELTTIKNVAESYFTAAGNILHYSFSVENTGFTHLLGPITVTDDKIGSVSCQDVSAVGDFDNYLDQNEIVNCPVSGTVDYTVLASPDVAPNKQVTNNAYASAGGVDSSTVSKTVPLAPDLTVLKTHLPSGTIVLGNTFNWTLEVSNSSTAGPASFAVGQTILSDSLPTGATYDPIIIMGGTLFLGPGTIDCTINGGMLTCIASGDSVTLPSSASFSATILVTPTSAGTLVNPTNGGTCQVDPGAGVIAEINDANNDCNPDTVIVEKASPTITTNASPTTGTVGTQVLKAGDTATLTGGYNPTGVVTFTLYSDSTCTTPIPSMSGSGTISAGSASWSANWTPTAAGTYYWTAGYAGDSNNNSYTTGCTDANEQIVIARASPTLSTTPNPSSATNGDTLNDTAALSGGYNATGSVTFNLYGPTDTTCSGIPAYTETDASSPYATTAGFASNAVGTWRWTATYSGDTNNDAATSGCTAELVTVAVNLLPAATDNSYTVAANGTASGNVMTDGVADTLGDPPTTVTTYDAASVNGGIVTVAADGSFTYDPNGYVGTDTFTYTITDVNGDTSTATVTVNVYAPPTVTKSFAPSTIVVGGTSTMTIVVTNPASNPGNLTGVSIDDIYTGTLMNNAAGDVGCSGLGDATLTGGTDGGTSVGFSAGTIVPGGTCTITQSVTATSTNINTTGIPTATGPVSLTGTAANATLLTMVTIEAKDDTGTTIDAASGGTSITNVLLNNGNGTDLLNGVAATTSTVDITIVGTWPTGISLNTATGAVTVAPGTLSGTYTPQYQICDKADPTFCSIATVTVPVVNISAVNDTGSVIDGASGGQSFANVLTNDSLNGTTPVLLSDVNLTQISTTNASVTLNMADGSVNVAAGTPAGNYTVTYQICDKLNPSICSTATVTVPVVGILAKDDTGATIDGASGGTAITNVLLDNGNGTDLLNGAAATTSTVDISVVGTWPTGISLNVTTGGVTVAPGTPAGTYSSQYQICDKLNPSICSTATITIPVSQSLIGVSKRVVSKTEVTAGIWDITYEIYAKNYGNTILNNVQISDNLDLTFPSPNSYSIQSVTTSAGLTKNLVYSGSVPNINLLDGNDTLAVNGDGTITVTVRVIPANAGPFENTAIAGGQCPTCSTAVTDNSQNGTNPDPDNDKDPTNNNTSTPVDFGPNLFDPPFGLKTFDQSGLPLLQWTMVWINNSNIAAVNLQVSDPIVSGTTYVPGSVSCTPSGVTTTTLCTYDSPTNRIIWSGNLGPDLGATNAASAANEITITFRVNVAAGITSIQNVATVDSDLNGNQLITDPGEQQVASASRTWTQAQPVTANRLPDSGFAPNVVSDLSRVPHETYTATEDVTLEIPALGVKINVVGVPKKDGTWNVAWLGNQAGWLEGSAFPSWSGNSVLTGHVYNSNGLPGPFVNLNKLRYGDQIIIHAYGQKYIFEVRSNEVVEPNDKSVLKHEERPWLTLVTCKDYDEKTDTYKKRVVVRAVLVKVTTK